MYKSQNGYLCLYALIFTVMEINLEFFETDTLLGTMGLSENSDPLMEEEDLETPHIHHRDDIPDLNMVFEHTNEEDSPVVKSPVRRERSNTVGKKRKVRTGGSSGEGTS
ncbi:hypothetical protein L6452_44102 [Arctium lappa]|uniref:Uncharacterized protein n=1 Tax=Arctium lappa TaxID=4217 RepID=A0ACB8XFZ1_ARCLA|nr:hypothetical protein L6452_44102 [Arctium lappa]